MQVIPFKAESVPYEWRGVTFGQFKQICQNTSDGVFILSVFMGMDPEVIRKARVENFEVLMTRLKFLYTPPLWDEQPKKLGLYDIPADVTFESTGQFEDMKNVYKMDQAQLEEITKNPALEYQNFAKIAAIYYQPVRQNTEYNYTAAMDLIPELDALSCVEVVSVGRFFFAKLLSLRSGIPVSFLTANTPQRKRRPGFEGLMRRLTSTRPYRYLRTVISRGRIPYSK